jgi:hypothetical protein
MAKIGLALAAALAVSVAAWVAAPGISLAGDDDESCDAGGPTSGCRPSEFEETGGSDSDGPNDADGGGGSHSSGGGSGGSGGGDPGTD